MGYPRLKDSKPGKDITHIHQVRRIPPIIRLLITTKAGGRCEFQGCNKYLLEHPLTINMGNFSQLAHIVAFSEGGPRGFHRPDSNSVNDPDNLMLLCPECHKLIDDHPDQYSVSTLKKYKSDHEARIRHITGLGPELRTVIVQLKTKIAGHVVSIPMSHVADAVRPRYPSDSRGYIIDLTNIDDKGSFVQVATEEIRKQIARLYDPGLDSYETRHVSLFALAPIPLLIFLGRQMSNKVPVEVFQRHRDTEDWIWKESGDPVQYKFNRIRSGRNPRKVALLLSLSGKIHIQALPAEINSNFFVYEITLENDSPNPLFLRMREDLDRFKRIYQLCLRVILKEHRNLDEIHLFPAVPAPVAVLCGKELLPKVDPRLRVYDFDKNKGGFEFGLSVN